jgi:hypothetical protein
MTKYPAPLPVSEAVLKEALGTEDLVFPVARDFLSLPPRLDPQVMLRRLQETMPWRSTRPREVERRLASKVDVEFVL